MTRLVHLDWYTKGYHATLVCLKCSDRFSSDNQGARADLDGPSFKAYYCPHCARLLDEQSTKGNDES